MGRTHRDAPPDSFRGRLDALVRESPELAQAASVLGALLPLLREADLGAEPVATTPAEARERLAQGRHLLEGLALEVDADRAQRLMLRLARALETVRPSEPTRRLRKALERADPHARALLPLVAAGQREAVASVGRTRGLDGDLLWTLASAGLRPAFRAWCLALEPLAADVSWPRGSCFVCGAGAALGELRADGALHLRCALCGASWRVRRLQCPACGNDDHGTLRTLYEEGRRDTRRVEACDRCRRYVKIIAAAAPTAAEVLVLEDLATIRLDRIARERGYVAGR